MLDPCKGSSESSEDSSEEASSWEEERIDLTAADREFDVSIYDQTGRIVLTLRPSTPVAALLEAYASQRNLALGAASTLRLVLDGQLLPEQGTAGQAGLTAGSVLGCLQLR